MDEIEKTVQLLYVALSFKFPGEGQEDPHHEHHHQHQHYPQHQHQHQLHHQHHHVLRWLS